MQALCQPFTLLYTVYLGLRQLSGEGQPFEITRFFAVVALSVEQSLDAKWEEEGSLSYNVVS